MYDPEIIGVSEETLLEEAQVATKLAYCPYSHFPVGAAVVMKKGVIVHGNNVENASYGLTICAERAAIFDAISRGFSGPILAMAVSCAKGDPNDPDSLMPCGACRQVIQEFADEKTVIVVDKVGTFLLKDLLPRAFKLPS